MMRYLWNNRVSPVPLSSFTGRHQKKGFFGGLFHKKLPPTTGPAAPPKPAKAQSAATAAASKWVRGATPAQSTSSLADGVQQNAAENPTTALLAAKVRAMHAHALALDSWNMCYCIICLLPV
jgi:hypothetical protein